MANVISADICGPAKMTDVPDGEWPGVWSGYQVTAVCGHGKWTFTTDEGVRGIGLGCIVTVKSGRISVKVHHPPLTDIPQRATPATVAQIEAQVKQVSEAAERCDSEESCVDTDGAPTEMAVLKRFWIEYHNKGK